MSDRYVATSASPGADVDSLGGASSPITTQGDLAVGDATGAPMRLAKGAEGKVLRSGATTVSWEDPPAPLYSPTIYRTSVSIDGDYGAPCTLNWSYSTRPAVPADGRTYTVDVEVYGSHQTYTATRAVFRASFAVMVRTWWDGNIEVIASGATTELAAGGAHSLSGVTLALVPIAGGNTFDIEVTSPSPVIGRYTGRVEIRG